MQSQRLEELIRAERAVAPEAGAEARIWAAVEHRLAHGPPPPPGAEAAPAAALGAKGVLVKLVAGALLVAGGGALLAGRGEDVPGDRAVAVADARGVAVPEGRSASDAAGADGGGGGEALPPVGVGAVRSGESGVEGVREDRPEVAAAEAPADTRTPAPEKKRRRTTPRAEEAKADAKADAPALETDFAAELRLIGELRAAVRRGDAGEALAKVEEHVRRFGSGGQLAQEREAYRVEALCAAGRSDEAKRAAEALLKRWPDTTHAPRVKQSCAGA